MLQPNALLTGLMTAIAAASTFAAPPTALGKGEGVRLGDRV